MGAAQDSPGFYMYLLQLNKKTTGQKVAFSGLRNLKVVLAFFSFDKIFVKHGACSSCDAYIEYSQSDTYLLSKMSIC
jgi:hypothetical protein